MAYIPEAKSDSPFSRLDFPFGIFSTKENAATRCGTAIGDSVLDLGLVSKKGIFADELVIHALAKVCRLHSLSAGMC
jgi:hypothetical protein